MWERGVQQGRGAVFKQGAGRTRTAIISMTGMANNIAEATRAGQKAKDREDAEAALAKQKAQDDRRLRNLAVKTTLLKASVLVGCAWLLVLVGSQVVSCTSEWMSNYKQIHRERREWSHIHKLCQEDERHREDAKLGDMCIDAEYWFSRDPYTMTIQKLGYNFIFWTVLVPAGTTTVMASALSAYACVHDLSLSAAVKEVRDWLRSLFRAGSQHDLGLSAGVKDVKDWLRSPLRAGSQKAQ